MRFKILHGFRLQATKKLLMPGQLYSTDDAAELAELRDVYIPHKAAEEIVPVTPAKKAPEKQTVDPNDDITLVDGIGAGLSKKLATAGITTKSGLKASIEKEEVKALLGNSYEKIAAQFVETTDVPPAE